MFWNYFFLASTKQIRAKQPFVQWLFQLDEPNFHHQILGGSSHDLFQ